MTIDEFFAKHNYLKTKRGLKKTNYKKIPVNALQMNSDGKDKFNAIYQDLLKMDLNTLIRTNSGGISNDSGNMFNNMYAWDVRKLSSMIEITIRTHVECRIQFRQISKLDDGTEELPMSGHTAFMRFKKLCSEAGIDLDKYADNDFYHAKEIKNSIPKPKICLADEMWKDKIITNAHHIDFHNSYPAGLCNTHPEFRPVIEPLYNERHDHPENKLVLNATIGYMQSAMPQVRARWAQLSHDAIKDNNDRIDALAQELIDNGYTIIAYNTDGIWYAGRRPYHGDNEGPALGQWENDHKYCKLRFKSDGAYEFIENGEYTPKVRGYTNLDKIKDRSEWTWGDIYNYEATPVMFSFDKETGIIENTEVDII